MPRTARVAPGGMVFHVLNRANARARIFGKDADYAAFERVMKETLAKKPMRILGYLIMPNHWHLVLWPEQDGDLATFMQRLTTAHVRALALASQDGWLRAPLSRNLQVLSGGNRRALADGSLLRGAERPARGTGRAGRGLAMVEPVAMAARRSDGGCAARDEVAGRAAATMAVAGEPTASEGGVGSGANLGAARPSLRKHGLAGDDRRETWDSNPPFNLGEDQGNSK